MAKKRQIEGIAHKSYDFREAEAWDIEQHIRMTPQERQEVARQLRRRVYGEHPPDVRESHPSDPFSGCSPGSTSVT